MRCAVDLFFMNVFWIMKKLFFDDDTNPSLANVPILYPLKRTEKLWSSGVFRIYEMET